MHERAIRLRDGKPGRHLRHRDFADLASAPDPIAAEDHDLSLNYRKLATKDR
jgi:hypothetical protein